MAMPDRSAARLATRLAFLVAGFGVACWAPLVPFAKQRLGVDDGILGLLLLCLGLGSVIAMPITGAASARYGSRSFVIASGAGLALTLPLLIIVATPTTLGIALFAFGATLGSLDVAMNIHAVEVERREQRPLMSGFHALFSVGAFTGSALMTFLLSAHVDAFQSTLLCGALMLGATLICGARLIETATANDHPLFAAPHGIVLLLAGLAATAFLVEGAILDWSALLIIGKGLTAATDGGLGYMVFSIAMTAGRLYGDALAARIGDRSTLFWGGLVATFGFIVLLTAPVISVALIGFLLIGLGASNIVPVLFRRAASQHVMPSALAIAAVSTSGYAGNLVGPAAIGFVANAVGLPGAFWLLAVFFFVVPCCAWLVTKPRS
jgi:predicted MFS family arabinose efflux permease